MTPANDNFRMRVRTIKDKRTGSVVRVHNFAKQRHDSVNCFMKRAIQIADLLHDGIGAFCIVAFNEEMNPSVTYWVADHVVVGPDILAAAVSEALRTRRTTFAIDDEPNDDDDEDPPRCA